MERALSPIASLLREERSLACPYVTKDGPCSICSPHSVCLPNEEAKNAQGRPKYGSCCKACRKSSRNTDRFREGVCEPVSAPTNLTTTGHPDLTKSKLLTPERMEALKSVNFEFQLWTVEPSQWEQRFQELLAYRRIHGHFHVTNKQNATLSR